MKKLTKDYIDLFYTETHDIEKAKNCAIKMLDHIIIYCKDEKIIYKGQYITLKEYFNCIKIEIENYGTI
jgi:hypothetical protein